MVADLGYIRVHSKRDAVITIMQLLFIDYKVSSMGAGVAQYQQFHRSTLSNDMKKAGYILINKENKTIIGFVKIKQAYGWKFPKDYSDYTETTIKELTE